jgi:hypothetical protein
MTKADQTANCKTGFTLGGRRFRVAIEPHTVSRRVQEKTLATPTGKDTFDKVTVVSIRVPARCTDTQIATYATANANC